MRKLKIFNKKGVELTLNVVIISILVLLVMVVIVGMFLGGTSQLKDFASKILRQNVAGTDIDIAIGQCEQWCAQARDWPEDLKKTSPYCMQNFNLDLNGDGTADLVDSNDKGMGYIGYSCRESVLGVPCPDVAC